MERAKEEGLSLPSEKSHESEEMIQALGCLVRKGSSVVSKIGRYGKTTLEVLFKSIFISKERKITAVQIFDIEDWHTHGVVCR